MRLLMEYFERHFGRHLRRATPSSIDWVAKREGRMGAALFLFGFLALALAAMLLATAKL